MLPKYWHQQPKVHVLPVGEPQNHLYIRRMAHEIILGVKPRVPLLDASLSSNKPGAPEKSPTGAQVCPMNYLRNGFPHLEITLKNTSMYYSYQLS